jgi:hypothetical protein
VGAGFGIKVVISKLASAVQSPDQGASQALNQGTDHMTSAKFLKSGLAAAMVLFAASSFAGPTLKVVSKDSGASGIGPYQVANNSEVSKSISFATHGSIDSLSVAIGATSMYLGDVVYSLSHTANGVTKSAILKNNSGDSSNLTVGTALTFLDDKNLANASTIGAGCDNNGWVGTAASQQAINRPNPLPAHSRAWTSLAPGHSLSETSAASIRAEHLQLMDGFQAPGGTPHGTRANQP